MPLAILITHNNNVFSMLATIILMMSETGMDGSRFITTIVNAFKMQKQMLTKIVECICHSVY